jgi:hypothetical protein
MTEDPRSSRPTGRTECNRKKPRCGVGGRIGVSGDQTSGS